MMRSSKSLLLGLLALAGCASGGTSQPAENPPENAASALPPIVDEQLKHMRETDRTFEWTLPTTPGCAVGVFQNGKQILSRAYGSADLERATPMTPDTIFDIGSLQKQFVAAAVLLLVQDRRLALTDDIRKHIPELPDYGRTVTINHLLTHTSGIRDWTALLPLAADKPDALTAILRQRGLNFAPGDEWSYSNSNFVLLKEIVARTSGTSFADFARHRLFQPLGMKRSLYSVDMRDDVPNRAVAYEKQSETWKVSMRLDNDRGGGGILTTTGDMLIWNEALSTNRLGAFVTTKLHEPSRLNSGRSLRYARGLIVDEEQGSKLIWHSGGSAGFNAWLGRFPDQKLSLALACNRDVEGGTLVRQIFAQFLPASPDTPPAPPAAPDPNLSAKAGMFISEADGEILRLGVDRGRLRIAGGPPLTALGPDRYGLPKGDLFFRSQDAFEIRFTSADTFEIKSMEGATTRFRRTATWTPTDLSAFAGRYQSNELKTVFNITPGDNLLAAKLEHAPGQTLQFRPVLPDTFQVGAVTLRFQRDAAGKVTAVDYSNPVLRNVRLTRIG